MAFIQPCFIKRISSELKEKLKEFGYKDAGKVRLYGESQYLYCESHIFYESPCTIKCRYNNFIDCEYNEDLFLSIAALRDDTDDYQWLTNDTHTYWERKETICLPSKYMQLEGHKATLQELIEHFKYEQCTKNTIK
jgi:hypothetical protein